MRADMDLLMRAKSDPEALDQFIRANSRLICECAWRAIGRRERGRPEDFRSPGGLDYDDVYQCAAIGMILAVRRFDPARGLAFSSFAVPYMVGSARRAFRENHAGGVRLARPLFESGMHPEVESMDAPFDAGDGEFGGLHDRIAAPDDTEAEATAHVVLAEVLAAVRDPRARRILAMRAQGLTQEEIGRRAGISQVQVSRVLGSLTRGMEIRPSPHPRRSPRPVSGRPARRPPEPQHLFDATPVLRAVESLTCAYRRPPAQVEVGRATNLPRWAMQYAVRKLRAQGLLVPAEGLGRASRLILTDAGRAMLASLEVDVGA
jgi:RNA polymerase sigma factor (sigma-70 family)